MRLQPALGRVRAIRVPTPFAPASHQMCPTVRGDDVLAQVQANASAFALFGIHPAVVFHPEELLEDALAELALGSPARHPSRQDAGPTRLRDPAFCLDTATRTTPPGGRVLQGVGQHVVQHHQQTAPRRPDRRRSGRLAGTSSLTPDSSNRGPHCRTASSTSRHRSSRSVDQAQLARIGAGEVEELVDRLAQFIRSRQGTGEHEPLPLMAARPPPRAASAGSS